MEGEIYFICPSCGREHSLGEFQKSRFCINCSKFLSYQDKKVRPKNFGVKVTGRGSATSGFSVIVTRLLEFRETIDTRDLVPVLVPQAANLIKADPFAFLLAGVLDRGTKAEIIWTVPYYLKRALGHLDPYFFANASLQELRLIIRRLPAKPRYLNDAPRTVKGLSQIIMRKFDGKAERLWENRSSRAVKATLESIHGVGPGIASMIVLFLEDWFKVPFNDVDHRTMDVKPDVHVIRVFYRLGLISTPTSEAALHAARRLNASYPGALDAPAWTIGRKWCHSHNPNCGDCLMDNLCPKKLDKTI